LVNRVYLLVGVAELILAALETPKETRAEQRPVMPFAEKHSNSNVLLLRHVLLSLFLLVVDLRERLSSFPIAVFSAGYYLDDA